MRESSKRQKRRSKRYNVQDQRVPAEKEEEEDERDQQEMT